MPSNVSHPCAAKGPTGKPCRRMVKSETGTDPDGQFRCFSHTTDPARAERRRVTSESDENRRAGREGKRRHVATARAVAAHERAAGVGPAPRGRRGGSGLPLPPGVKVPKEGEPIVIPAEAVEAQSRELRISEFRQHAILDGVDEHLALVDQTGTIIAVNSSWAKTR